jgi:hypothetical protein
MMNGRAHVFDSFECESALLYKQPSGCWSQFLQNRINATLQRHSQLTQVIRPFTHSSKSIMLGKLRTRELLLAPIDRQAGEPH